VHPEAYLAQTARVIGDVELGAQSSVWFGAVLRGDVEPIRIGRRSNIQDLAVVHVTTGGGPTTIGDDVTVGHGAVVHGCTVHRDCLIGIGAIVLDGAEVGPEAIVAAGAVVPAGMRVPPRTMARGVPARIVRALTDNDVQAIRASARTYVELARAYSPT
jgi:carbonic anhydrase/acetyltransferase-like protein (isoleucine patch superfamily)